MCKHRRATDQCIRNEKVRRGLELWRDGAPQMRLQSGDYDFHDTSPHALRLTDLQCRRPKLGPEPSDAAGDYASLFDPAEFRRV